MLAVTNTSPSIERDGPGDRLRDPLGDELDGLLAGHVLAEDRELVAAEAGHDVGRAHHRAQPVGDRHQQPVAGGVPEAVVHHLEAVEVEEQHRDALAALAAARASSRPRRSTNCEPVRQAGERVVDRLVRERLTAGPAARRCPRSGTRGTAAGRCTSRTSDALTDTQTGCPSWCTKRCSSCALWVTPVKSRRTCSRHWSRSSGWQSSSIDEAQQLRFAASEDLHQRAVHAEEPTVDRDERHADRRVLERAAEPLLRLAQLGFGAAPVGEVAGADDDALDRRVVEQVGGHRLDHAPAAVGVAQAHLDAVGVLARRAWTRSRARAVARSSGWMRSNTSVPMSGSMSSPRIRSVTGLAYTSRPWGSTIAMMSLESRTIARKRASLRSRSAVTWSTVRAARRPTTRVETIASTTIARSRPLARRPSATHVLSVGLRPSRP